MAKRTRGSRRDRRRGARSATFAPPAPRAAVQPQASQAPTAAAAGPEDAYALSGRALPSSRDHSPTQVRPGSVLSAKAVEEYRYVSLDLRRIALVMGTLFAAMLALWVVVDVLRIVTV